MRLAIFSDVHGQVGRLTACLEAVARAGADELWCLGDAIDGLSARPPELTVACVRAINDVCSVKHAGNHEAWALQRPVSAPRRGCPDRTLERRLAARRNPRRARQPARPADGPMSGTYVKRFAGYRDGCARTATLIRLRCGSAAPTGRLSVSAARRPSASGARCERSPALAR